METMIIEKITIKNKKGETLELTKEEYEELKIELNSVPVYVVPIVVAPYPLYNDQVTCDPILEMTKIIC